LGRPWSGGVIGGASRGPEAGKGVDELAEERARAVCEVSKWPSVARGKKRIVAKGGRTIGEQGQKEIDSVTTQKDAVKSSSGGGKNIPYIARVQ